VDAESASDPETDQQPEAVEQLGDERTRLFYVLLMLLALLALVGVALATTWWALLALGYAVPALKSSRVVRSGASGPGLVPVLQLTGVAELLYGLGLLVGLGIGG
jgi:1,4-dihydroxy-2-naphthoate octaprenyltransferase